MARTNNELESLFHAMKHGERRRSGRKILTQDFEALPPAAALAQNLRHADYVHLVCGSLDRWRKLSLSSMPRIGLARSRSAQSKTPR